MKQLRVSKKKKDNSYDESQSQNESSADRINRLDNIIKLIKVLIGFSKKQKALAI